jgi:hypothetical protein
MDNVVFVLAVGVVLMWGGHRVLCFPCPSRHFGHVLHRHWQYLQGYHRPHQHRYLVRFLVARLLM